MQPCPEGKLQMKDMKILIQSHGLYVDIHRNKLLPIKPLYCIYQHILSYWKAVLSCMFLFFFFPVFRQVRRQLGLMDTCCHSHSLMSSHKQGFPLPALWQLQLLCLPTLLTQMEGERLQKEVSEVLLCRRELSLRIINNA